MYTSLFTGEKQAVRKNGAITWATGFEFNVALEKQPAVLSFYPGSDHLVIFMSS